MAEVNVIFPLRTRVDYRQWVKEKAFLESALVQIRSFPFPVLPNGDIDSIEARRILSEHGIENATIVGTPLDYDLVSL